MQIGNFLLGSGRVFIIAEVGSNHCQSLAMALQHVRMAAECGADAVKFQCLSVDRLYFEPSDEIRQLHGKIDLPEAWIPELARAASECGVEFMSSATYLESVDILEAAGTKAFKLASAQVAVYPQVVDKVARLGKPTILSTGLVETAALDRVVEIFRSAGNNHFIILHCNSVYPAPPAIVQLGRMRSFRERYGCLVGFSDHTESSIAAVAATALGASVIERHFTLSRTLDSPDAPISSEPREFSDYCRAIREAETICSGLPRDWLEPQEAQFRSRIGHYLVSTRSITAGEVLDDRNSALMRGAGWVDAWAVYHSSGMRAAAAITAGEWVRADQIEWMG